MVEFEIPSSKSKLQINSNVQIPIFQLLINRGFYGIRVEQT